MGADRDMLNHNLFTSITTIVNETGHLELVNGQRLLPIGFGNIFSFIGRLFLQQNSLIFTRPFRFAKLDISKKNDLPQNPTRHPESNDPNFDEQALLKKLPSLEPEIVTQIHNYFYPVVYRYAHYRLSDPNIAEDLASEVFLLLLETVHKGRGPQNTLRGWLMGTISNLVNDYYRKAYKRPSEELSDDIPATSPGPGALIEMTQKHASVRTALLKLTPDQQNVLALRFGSGYSLEETANVIGKRVNAVKQLQLRALESLRRHLGEEH